MSLIIITTIISFYLTKYINNKREHYEKQVAFENGYKIIENEEKLSNIVENIITYMPLINIIYALDIYFNTLNDPYLIDNMRINGELEIVADIKELSLIDDIEEKLEIPLLISVTPIENEEGVSYFVASSNTTRKQVLLVYGPLSILSDMERQIYFNNYLKENPEGLTYDYEATSKEHLLKEYASDALDKYLGLLTELEKFHKKKELLLQNRGVKKDA